MDLKATIFYLIGVTTLLQNLQQGACHTIMKRNALQLCNLIHLHTGRYCLNYYPYGCFCGLGQQGTQPTDNTDRCCKDHDDCYGDVNNNNHCSFWGMVVGYNYDCSGIHCQCNNPDTSECARQVCECDLRLAQCLGENDYNLEYKNYERSQCV